VKNEAEHIYSGIPTFMQSPYIALEQVPEYDVAILGIPVDYGATYRGGQRFAPRAIREYSLWGSISGKDIFDFAANTTLKTNNLTIGDLGDILVWPGESERTNEAIIQTVRQIRATSFPLIMGGDHSITYAAFIGCKQALEQSNQLPLGLLHFDAHVDTEESYSPFPRVHHGNVFGELIREGHLHGKHMVSIGSRAYESAKWIQFANQAGIKRYTMSEVGIRSLSVVLAEAIRFLKSTCRAVYVTFDIDCLDPSQAPGTGILSFGGILVQDLLPTIEQLSDLPVAAFDLVELSPPLDPSGLTTFAACDILWQFLAFGLDGKSRTQS